VTSEPVRLTVKSKIWIANGKGEVVFGEGRLKILKAVDRSGSILGAATELHMSYRAVWGKIKASEDRLGKQLLTKQTGGKHGGGSVLTPFAKTLIESFRHLEALIKTTTDVMFEGIFATTLAERPKEGGENNL
jgi:molybdate transport system regulatory protein